MKGRKPTPINIRLVKGNPGHRPVPKEAQVSAQIPEAPEHLSEAAAREWATITPLLHSAGLVATVDRAALAAYCAAYGRWAEAEEAIKKHGMLVKSPNGFPMLSPYLIVANKAMDQMTRMLVEFGMSPSSRSRVKAETPTDAKDAVWAAKYA